MPRNVLFEVSPVDPATGLTVTLRMASAGADQSGVLLNSYEWKPLITDGPVRSIRLFSGGQVQPIDLSHGDLSFRLHANFGNEAWSTLAWEGAYARIFVGNLGDDFSLYTQIFEGRVGPLQRQGGLAKVTLTGPEADLDTNLLTASYQGTGNAEGDIKLKGMLKPVAYGACSNVAPVLIDAANWIYQVHNGAINDVPMVYENAYQVNATSAATVANYAALKALSLAPGQWAKAPAVGMFRLGGQPNGKITADVQGALRASDSAYVTTIATIVPEILKVAGLSSGKIDQTSFNAFSAYSWSFYATDQVTVGEVARDALRQCGGYLFPSSTGVFKVGNFYGSRTAIALKQDRSATPLVRSITQATATPPNYRIKIGADRCWSVHSENEISSAILDAGTGAAAANAAALAAQTTANGAAANSVTALSRLDAIVNDGILDRSEKAQVNAEFSKITAEKAGINSTATGLGITTENTAYNTAYSTLNSYLGGLSPTYSNTAVDTAITRTTWDSNWNGLYSARQSLLNKIANVTATLANWTGITATPTPIANVTNTTVIDNGNITINGSGQINTGAGTLTPIIDNGKITVSAGTLNGIGTANVAVDNAYQLWNQVSGTGKPADNATSDVMLVLGPTYAASGLATLTGNKVTRVSGTQDFPYGAFYSKTSFTGQCYLSWQPNAAGQNKLEGMGISSAQVEPNGTLTNVNWWFGNNYGRGWLVRNNGSVIASASAPAYNDGDVFSIAYDGTSIKFAINDVVKYTATGVAANLTFYAIGSVCDLTATIENIRWLPHADRSWLNIGGTGKPADNATVGAQAGTNLKDSGGSILGDSAIKNLAITVDGTGTIQNIGTSSIVVDNTKQLWSQVNSRPTNLAALTGTESINNSATNGNLIANSDFATGDLTNWSNFAQGAFVSVVLRTDATIQSGAPTKYVMKLAALSGGNSGLEWAAPKAYNATGAEFEGIRVVPGEQYFVALDVAATAAYTVPTSSAQIQIYYLLADGSLTGGTGGNTIAYTPTTTWTTITGSFTAPANAVRAWLGIYWTHSAGVLSVTNLRCWQKGSVNTLTSTAVRLGTNITKNDGTTSLTDALAVTSLGTAAGIAGQAATATSSDFAVITGTTKPANNATVGAQAGVNLKDSGGTVLGDSAVKNSAITVDASGILQGVGTASIVVNNSKITVDASGIIQGIGTGSVVVDNGKVTLSSAGVLNGAGGGSITALPADNLVDGSTYGRYALTERTKLSGVAANATVGAQAGTNLKDSGGTVLSDSAIKNSAITLSAAGALSGAGGGAIAYDSVADGTTYAKILASQLSSGTPKLSVAGSGVRLADPRNLPAISALNLGYKFTGAITYSATAGTPATATISVAAGSALIGTNSIAYSAMSANITGTNNTTVSYWLYVDDATFAGGAQTLVATTTANNVYSADGRVYIGAVDVTFPASGGGSGGGGGGGGYCVAASAWVETRDRGFVPARDIVAGDLVRVLDEDRTGTEWEPVTSNMVAISDAVTITAGGIELTVSVTTPITLRDGSIIFAPEIDGHDLPAFVHSLEWEPATIAPAGEIEVAHIRCSGRTYAAGNVPGRSILTHNPVKP